MAHVALKKLTIRSCRSIVDRAEIVLPENGLVLIKGTNADTKGSSGSGKTSLLLGLAYAFGYSPFPGTALQSWHTDDPLEVEVVFDCKEGEVVLRRGAKTSLTVNGQVIKGSVKAVEERLAQLVGLSPQLLEALTYRGQKQRSLFLSMSDADKKDFLASVLGLDRIEEEAEKAAQTAKALEADYKTSKTAYENFLAMVNQLKDQAQEPVLESEEACLEQIAKAEEAVNSLKTSLAATQTAMQALQEEAQAAKDSVFAKYSGKIEALKQEIAQASAKSLPEVDSSKVKQLQTICNEVKRRLAEAKNTDEARRQELSDTKTALEKQIAQAKVEIASMDHATTQMNQVHEQIRQLEESKCPTCKRSWEESAQEKEQAYQELARLQAVHDLANQKRQSIVDIAKQIQYLPEHKPDPAVAQFEEALKQLEGSIAVEESRLKEFEQDFNRSVADQVQRLKTAVLEANQAATDEANQLIQEKLTELRGKQEAAAATRSALDKAEASLFEAKTELNDLRFRNKQGVTVYQTVLNQIAAAEARAADAKAAFEKIKDKYQTEADLAQVLGREGFLGTIFDEVLAEIAQETNAILATVPNTSAVTMAFRTESTTQKGTVKKSICPVISVAGHEAPFASGLSGGMQTALELAVDLGISIVVGRRTGAAPGWLILDEAFEGLGFVEKECCLEILSKFATNKMVLIVDHDNQFKEMFTKTISVECLDGRTTVR